MLTPGVARYVRELGVLTLPEAAEHLAGRPARVVGLSDRGVLREGAAADLVLLDPMPVTDHARYEPPAVWPPGSAPCGSTDGLPGTAAP